MEISYDYNYCIIKDNIMIKNRKSNIYYNVIIGDSNCKYVMTSYKN